MSKLLTIKEVAERLRVTYHTAYKYIRKEKIPAIKLERGYRIREEDLEEYLKSRTYST